jgi:serine/threonine protein kinase
LRGSDLARFLRHRGRVSARQAALLLLQACDALAEAHALGIVHRDIKLENLFLTCRPGHEARGYLKVLDFGLSKVFMDPGSAQDEVTVTDTQCVLGSPEFMSPEQTRCSRDVDARTDIWALGAVLYALLSGRRPFARRFVADVRYAVLAGEYLPLESVCDDLPVGLDSIVQRCLQLDRDARYESVKELAAALEPFAKTPRRTGSTPPPQPEIVPFERSRSDTSAQRPRRLEHGPLSFLQAPGNPKVSS